ncbi:MAG: hemolysin family protein [Muribaculaceae bacterium]
MKDIFIIIALILLNGLFAMAEIALISARKTSLSNDAKRGSKSAKRALLLANEPDKFLSVVQIGITLIGILTGIYSGDVLATDFSTILINIGVPSAYAHSVAQILIIAVVTYLSIILGELVPKRIGLGIAEKTAKIVALPMYIISIISSPFVWLLSKSTSLIFNLFKIDVTNNKVTENEIKMIIQEGTDSGEVQEVEQDIMERALMLGDLKISSIMTHRNEIVALDINMTIEQIKCVLEKHLYEIYPVIDGDLDSTIGIVSLKDIALGLYNRELSLSNVSTPAIYFYENMKVYKVLEQMKQQRLSRALVCDEFGSCQGIITLKDILEGLVGSIDGINDEPNIVKRSDGDGWLVDGQSSFYDFLSYFEREYHYDNNKFSTLSGLILNILERIPNTGEIVKWNEFTFEIVDMDGARIDKILVTITNK